MPGTSRYTARSFMSLMTATGMSHEKAQRIVEAAMGYEPVVFQQRSGVYTLTRVRNTPRGMDPFRLTSTPDAQLTIG